MKIKEGYVLRSVAGQHIVMPVGQEAVNFNGLIHLNNSGKMLFERLQKGATEEDLVNLLCVKYEVNDLDALNDVTKFLSTLKEKNIIE